MKRLIEDSPVVGYQLFRYEGKRADGTPVVYPQYYIRHNGIETSTKTEKLNDARLKVKRLAGQDAQHKKRLNARVGGVKMGELFDLVIEDYKQGGQKTIGSVRGKIDNGLRPFFGDMIAARVDSAQIDRWMKWRRTHRERKSEGQELLKPSSINRELSIIRRAFQLGY